RATTTSTTGTPDRQLDAHRHPREPGTGHLPGRLRDRRDLLGPAPGDRLRRLQRIAHRAVERADDDVAAALRLRRVTSALGQAAAARRVTRDLAASTSSG